MLCLRKRKNILFVFEQRKLIMNKWQKTIYVIIGTIFVLFLICLYIIGTKMGYSVKEHRESDFSPIVSKIENYINNVGCLPASLSELGFEQTPGLYCYNGFDINLINMSSENEYLLELWLEKPKLPKMDLNEKLKFVYFL